jgi:hypothetical protein
MSKSSDFRIQAAECLRRVNSTDNEENKRTWLMLGESWLLLEKFQQIGERRLQAAKCELATLFDGRAA